MTENEKPKLENEVVKKKKQKISKEEKVDTKEEDSQKQEEKKEQKIEEKKEETKEKEKPKRKKIEVVVKAYNVPISTKEAAAICKFIKKKIIGKAISDLEEVRKMKKAVPMKGEIPHRKGNIMSGRYPQKAAKNFIILLKSLLGNANFNEIEEPIVFEAFANIGSRPYGRFGRYRRKRTNIVIRAIEKNKLKEIVK